MRHPLNTARKGMLLLTMLCLALGAVDPFTAEAAKKKGGPDPAAQAEAEFQKNLEPLSTELHKLMIKIESRGLLSPDEAGQLADLKFKLLDMMNQFPQNALIAKPVYQAGILFTEREEYNDAFEMFSFLAQGFPTNPYGAKARGQIQLLEKRFGPNYFIVEGAASAAATPTASAETKDAATAKPPEEKK